ncbi:NAD(P)H-dependent glycerol-3-phosphate dehydrogenase [Hydrogenobaculum acidophilum]
MIFVFGAGKWGNALSYVLNKKNIPITIYDINAENLSKISSQLQVKSTTDVSEISRHSLVIIAIPTQSIKHILDYCKEKDIIIASKGIDISTHKDVVDLALEHGIKKENLFVLSGPSFAEDVLRDLPVALTLGYFNKEKALNIQNLISSSLFRVYTSNDIKGVALGGAIKNVMAIASGIVEGAGLGESAQAALVTRGLKEMIKIGKLMGAKEKTFYGLSGIGDLFLTASSNKSRNKRFGLLIGKKKTPKEALEEIKEVVEGYYTTKALYDIAIERNLDLPITKAVYKVLYENMSIEDSMKSLLSRELKEEDD